VGLADAVREAVPVRVAAPAALEVMVREGVGAPEPEAEAERAPEADADAVAVPDTSAPQSTYVTAAEPGLPPWWPLPRRQEATAPVAVTTPRLTYELPPPPPAAVPPQPHPPPPPL
jgi:hypothetical protein